MITNELIIRLEDGTPEAVEDILKGQGWVWDRRQQGWTRPATEAGKKSHRLVTRMIADHKKVVGR